MIRRLKYAISVSVMAGVFHLCICSYNYASTTIWPRVAPMHKSIYFSDATNAQAKFSITSDNGKPLYMIECHTWRFMEDYVGNGDFDYSGDFECRLTSMYSEDQYSTLFTENPKQDRDWDSRARFFVKEVEGKCASYPEYGRIRTFRLRGMKITLMIDEAQIKDVEGADFPRRRQFKSFRFSVSVGVDPKALSEIAEPTQYAEPPRAHPENPKDTSLNCEVIRFKGKNANRTRKQ